MMAESLASRERLQSSEVLLIGSDGFIGSEIRRELSQVSIYSPSIPELDITQAKEVNRVVHNFRGDTIINAAGMTDVQGIEKNYVLLRKAQKVNFVGARNIAEACVREGKDSFFIGSNYERAGSEAHPGPYSEEAPLADEVGEEELLGWYAQTKLWGDRAVRRTFKFEPSGLAVIFIDYPCGMVEGIAPEFQRHWYLQTLLMNQKKGYPAFGDQRLTITPVGKIGEVISIIRRENLSGVFNVAAKGVTTPYDLLRFMMEKLGEDPNQVVEGSIVEYGGKLKKEGKKLIWPVNGGLDVSHTEEVLAAAELGFTFPTWQELVDQLMEGEGGLREFWQSLK
jgi:dTDP-4-dehydrorhamnose reductase